MGYKLSYKRFGEQAILIEWPQVIQKDILKDLLRFKALIISHFKDLKLNVTTAYNSLLINDLTNSINYKDLIPELKSLYELKKDIKTENTLLWKIPVCYDLEFGLDLNDMAKNKNMSIENIIDIHSKSQYIVYFIGFLPGFLYLGGLDEKLHYPRKDKPRMRIERGAVAIGGEQTGIYPMESPGGWNIIGNSPINLFNTDNEIPCFAKAGDSIQFYSITSEKHEEIKVLVNANVYQLENEVIHG